MTSGSISSGLEVTWVPGTGVSSIGMAAGSWSARGEISFSSSGVARTSSSTCGPFTVSSTGAGNTISLESAVSSAVSLVIVSSAAASVIGGTESGTNAGCSSADFSRGSSSSFSWGVGIASFSVGISAVASSAAGRLSWVAGAPASSSSCCSAGEAGGAMVSGSFSSGLEVSSLPASGVSSERTAACSCSARVGITSFSEGVARTSSPVSPFSSAAVEISASVSFSSCDAFFSAVEVSPSSAGTLSSVGRDCGSFSSARVEVTSSSAGVEAISS
ncbi:hypothetical protein Mapa_012854 [Marchantia paleacea]|nr:hypothetical protein Mapa_012854 [Marchantia paleacea]